jgi:hypothetical protein
MDNCALLENNGDSIVLLRSWLALLNMKKPLHAGKGIHEKGLQGMGIPIVNAYSAFL